MLSNKTGNWNLWIKNSENNNENVTSHMIHVAWLSYETDVRYMLNIDKTGNWNPWIKISENNNGNVTFHKTYQHVAWLPCTYEAGVREMPLLIMKLKLWSFWSRSLRTPIQNLPHFSRYNNFSKLAHCLSKILVHNTYDIIITTTAGV